MASSCSRPTTPSTCTWSPWRSVRLSSWSWPTPPRGPASVTPSRAAAPSIPGQSLLQSISRLSALWPPAAVLLRWARDKDSLPGTFSIIDQAVTFSFFPVCSTIMSVPPSSRVSRREERWLSGHCLSLSIYMIFLQTA